MKDLELDGEFGPYRQSERKDLYKKYADQLVESGWAYYAFDTPEEIEDLEKKQKQIKKLFHTELQPGENLNNSLNLSEAEVQQKIRCWRKLCDSV